MTTLQAESVVSPPQPGPPPDRHFATDHLMADLKGRSVRGGVVTLSAQAAKFVLQLGSTAVLARLLTPADFGLIAMVTAITGFAALFKDLGLSQATVQRDKITHDQVSSLFWINVIASAAIGLVVAAAAPLVAWFYGEPRLLWVTVALGSTFLFGGLTAQHTALLRRQMRYLPLAKIEIASMLTGIVVAVAMALAGADYWALVGMVAGSAAANMVGAWAASGWRPGRLRRRTGLRPMLRFGGNLTGFNVLNYFTRNADNVIIGYVMGSGPLGLYSRAYGLLMLPIRQVNAPINSVVLPALCAIQHDDIAFRRYFRAALAVMTAGSMPLVVFAMVQARSLVVLLLGPQWEEAVPIFLALGPAAFMGTFNVAPGWLFTAKGRTRELFRYGLCAAPFTVVSFIVGANWGVVGVAWGFSIAFTVCYIVLVPFSCRGTSVRPGDYLLAMWRSVAASLLAAAAVVGVSRVNATMNAIAELSIGVPVFGLSFALSWIALPGGYRSARRMLQDASMLRFVNGRPR